MRSQTLIDFVLLNQPRKIQSLFYWLVLSLALLLCDPLGRKCTTHPPQSHTAQTQIVGLSQLPAREAEAPLFGVTVLKKTTNEMAQHWCIY